MSDTASSPPVQEIAKHLASLAPGRWNQHYLRSKLATDPLYPGVFNELQDRDFPLLDIGCGMGVLALFLRENHYHSPYQGIDFDVRKIRDGQAIVTKGAYQKISLTHVDARDGLPRHQGDVTILDILQFMDDDSRTELLKEAASRVAPDGKLIIRSGLRDDSMRYRITVLADRFAKLTRWMKTTPDSYPTEPFFQETLTSFGLKVTIKPFWGSTPFNNYLIVASRPPASQS